MPYRAHASCLGERSIGSNYALVADRPFSQLDPVLQGLLASWMQQIEIVCANNHSVGLGVRNLRKCG